MRAGHHSEQALYCPMKKPRFAQTKQNRDTTCTRQRPQTRWQRAFSIASGVSKLSAASGSPHLLHILHTYRQTLMLKENYQQKTGRYLQTKPFEGNAYYRSLQDTNITTS